MLKLKVAEANVTVQSLLPEAAREEIDTHSAEIAELENQLTANDAKLSKLLRSLAWQPTSLEE